VVAVCVFSEGELIFRGFLEVGDRKLLFQETSMANLLWKISY
jgi:hypothetical protein